MKFSLEARYEIWCDEHGDKITIGPDADGLGLVELRDHDDKGTVLHRLTFQPAQARLVARALLQAADDIERSEQEEKALRPETAPFR